jgi:predicted metal-binding membrane protein
MSTLKHLRRPLRRVTAPIAAAALVGLLAAGCASAAAAGPAAAQPSTSATPMAGCGSMPGMTMPACPTGSAAVAAEAAASAGGVNPVPTQLLGVADWQGMKITAEAMTAVPFLIYNGTTMQEVKPPKNVSFHLMVLLNDAQTGVVIPYASVWGTITEGSKTPFDESLWPMISRYMGPHYGNNVVLPGAGTYHLSVLVSPPVSARHVEYQDVWLKPHRVNFTFHWAQPSHAVK